MSNELIYRYFMYSTDHMNILSEMSKKQGKNLKLPYVVVNGVQKKYTAIVSNKDQYKYTDSKVIAEGYINNMKYTQLED